jgi:hypothetical protein
LTAQLQSFIITINQTAIILKRGNAMWKYIKGTEKDFEGLAQNITWIYNEGSVVASRYWIEETLVEPKQEAQQPLPSTEDINVADAMEQSPHSNRIGSMMNPAKDLPKIKLDVKKPIFDKGDDKEVKFIYSNNIYSVFELTDGDIFCIESSKVDTYFYNKPDVKTTEQLISDAWTYASNDGSLWASPTQLYYIAIKELIKHNVIDVSKTHEVPDDTDK